MVPAAPRVGTPVRRPDGGSDAFLTARVRVLAGPLGWASTKADEAGRCGGPMTAATCRLCDARLTETFYPLHVRICSSCLLVQLPAYVPGEDIFSDYAYFSSYSDSWVAHARRYADQMTARLGLGPDSLVTEVASNDGYLLQHFVAAGIPVLGVEPAGNVAEAARAKGIRTEVHFLGGRTGAELAGK